MCNVYVIKQGIRECVMSMFQTGDQGVCNVYVIKQGIRECVMSMLSNRGSGSV